MDSSKGYANNSVDDVNAAAVAEATENEEEYHEEQLELYADLMAKIEPM